MLARHIMAVHIADDPPGDAPGSPVVSSRGSSPSTMASRDTTVEFLALDQALDAIPCDSTRTALQLMARYISAATARRDLDSNLVRLMAHFGVAPLHERSYTGRLSSGSGIPTSGSPAPPCPICKSSKFANEKNLVQHLNKTVGNLGVRASCSKSCRFVPERHCMLMGVCAVDCNDVAATAFIIGYRNCFLASHTHGFDTVRSAAATLYLGESARVPGL